MEETSVQAAAEEQTSTEEVTVEKPAGEALGSESIEENVVGTELAHEIKEASQMEEGTTEEDSEIEKKELNNTSDTSGTCGTNVTWKYDKTMETLTISGSGYMDNYEYPDENKGHYYYHTPWGNPNITKIIVEDGVKSIGNNAFVKSGVLQVELPNSLEKIGDSAFYDCLKLSKIKIPDGVTTIGADAFSRFPLQGTSSSLASVEIPDSVTNIGASAFAYCNNLKSVKLPNNLIKIDSNTFSGCTNLTSVEFPESLQIIGSYAFGGTGLEAVKIPNKVIKIDSNAFYNCANLERVELPDSLMDIGSSAFSGCKGLKNIIIPENVSSIGKSAFYNCSTDLTLLVYNNSIAHNYAKENSLKYKVIATGISLDDIELSEGDTAKLTAKLEPEGASYPDVTWTSGNPNIAAIEDGSITGKQAGTCTVTATCGEYKATCKVTVTERKNVMDVYSDPPSGTKVAAGTQIELKCDTAGAKIYYTESGLDPSTNGQLYTQKITINTDTTIKAIAKKDGCIDSNVTELKFYVTTTDPDPKPDQVSKVYANYTSGAKINAGTKIELYCDTLQAVIYYTLDNKEPTTRSTRYTGAITINEDTVIKAIAVRDGYENSEVAELKFYVTGNPDPEPDQVSKVYANYTSGAKVNAGTKIELYCDTPQAVIYYTLDNKEPTTRSMRYTEAITINEDTVIKAMAVKEGYEDSDVAELKFYVTGNPDSEPTQVSKVYASYLSGQSVPLGTGISLYCDTPDATIYYTLDNTEPTTNSAHYTGEITISRDMVIKALAVKEGYTNSEVSVFYFYVNNEEPAEDDEVLPGDIPSTGVPSGMWVAAIKDQCYTGTAIKPEVHVYEGRKRLEEKKDYTVSYKKNVNKGTAEIVITGKGNYKDKQSAFFNITIKDITASDVVIDDMVFAYNGKPHKVAPTITYNGKKLKLDKDFKVEFGTGDYTQAGTYYMTVQGVGNYIGKVTQVKTVILDKTKMISKASIVKPSSKEYNDGKEVTLSTDELKVVLGSILVKDRDYEVSYVNNFNPGTATAVIRGKGEYAGTKQVKFKIVRKPVDIALANVTYGGSMGYTKGGCMPEPKVVYQGERLRKGIDYTVSYSKNKKVGNAVMIIKGKGRFTKSKTFTFVINQKSIEDVSVRVPDVLYTGKANHYQSKPVLTDTDGKVLAAGTDYTIQGYSVYGTPLDKSSNPSAYSVITVKLSGKGNYRGDISATYTLKQGIAIGGAKVSVQEKTYTGKPITLSGSDFKSATIKIDKNEANLIYGRDYTIVPSSYTQNIKKGTASVVIRGLGQYTGDKTVKFRITSKKIFF